jgi:probable rRNA maturation factor
MRLRIDIQYATSRKGVPHARSLRNWSTQALLYSGYSLQPTDYCLTLRIVGNAESRTLNRRWRGKDKPTNVLSFPSNLTNHDPRVTSHVPLGDLVLCAPVIAREAREQRKSPAAHWAHMVTHGVLHLLGYDHVKNRDAIRMEAREVEILSHFGYQDPYLGEEGAPRAAYE